MITFEEWWEYINDIQEVLKGNFSKRIAKKAWDAILIEVATDEEPKADADNEIRLACAILDETCIDCCENCPAAGNKS